VVLEVPRGQGRLEGQFATEATISRKILGRFDSRHAAPQDPAVPITILLG
jgi:hypothetical protein